MGFFLSKLLTTLILPPGILILMLLLGIVLIARHYTSTGIRIVITATVLLWMMSTPFIANTLMSMSEPFPAIPPAQLSTLKGEVIVVLGGGRQFNAKEYGDDTVNRYALERLRYAALIHKETKAPILVTGGNVLTQRKPEGHLMAESLGSFGISAKWIEKESRNTAENALYSYRILKEEGINHIILVTHAWHMPRAMEMFEKLGMHVTPAPTSFGGHDGTGISLWKFMPSAQAFLESSHALHETFGRWWYSIRY